MTLTVSPDGQITIPKDAVKDFGVGPGDEIDLDIGPDGRGMLLARSERNAPKNDLSRLVGIVKTARRDPVSLEEMQETIAKGWAGLLNENDDR